MQEARRRPTRRNPRWVHAVERAARLSPRTSGLGRTFVQVAGSAVLQTLARGFTWRATADGPREFGTFHWTPSSRFRLVVAPRAGM